MDSVNTMAIADRIEADTPLSSGLVDTTPFIGRWSSTNQDTQGIARLVVRADGHNLLVQAFGAGNSVVVRVGVK